MRLYHRLAAVPAPLLLLAVPALCLPTQTVFAEGITDRISVATSGDQSNGGSGTLIGSTMVAVSADGRYVAFCSEATDLVPDDTNARVDVFVRDRQTDTTERASVSSADEQSALQGSGGFGGGPIPGDFGPALSADGRFVAFSSDAPNLVLGDANEARDVFVRDRVARTTERVSVTSTGAEGDADSAYVPSLPMQFDAPAISADGRFVAFSSRAGNLVEGDTNERTDVFVRDRLTGTTERVSVSSAGAQGNADFYCPAISADGRFVAFCGSAAANIVDADTNGASDVFIHDRLTGLTEAVSVTTTGQFGNGASGADRPALSADGRFVAFQSAATNLVTGTAPQVRSVYVRDRQLLTTELVTVTPSQEPASGSSVRGSSGGGATGSFTPAISADGRFVAFESCCTDLIPGDSNGFADVFLHDRLTGNTELVSLSSWGEQGDKGSCSPAVSADGRYVAFGSWSANLVSGDVNGAWDGFVRDRDGFLDVPFGHWAFAQISACVSAGVVTGYPDATYRPSTEVTRDQMAVYISRALVVPSGDAAIPTGPATASFSDVPTDHWAYKWVEYAVSWNVVQGYADGTYRPDEVVNRGQMAVYIARALVSPTGDAAIPDPGPHATFADVPGADNAWAWCYGHVEYLAGRGVVQGYADDTYRPADPVTRDQMAVYVARAFELPM